MHDATGVEAWTALAADIVDRAKKAGADAAEVYLREAQETEIEVRNQAVERLQGGAPRSVGLRLWRGDRSASTYGADLSPHAIDDLIAATLQLAPLTDPAPEQALPDAAWQASQFPPLDLYDAGVAAVDPQQKLAVARQLEAAAMAADPRITTSNGGSYSDLEVRHALANSNGFCAGYRESWVSYGVSVIADDAEGRKRNGSWSAYARHLADLTHIDEVARIAAERCVRTLGARPVSTRKVPVVFDPLTASALLGLLFGCLRGAAVEQGASYLADRMGKAVGSGLLHVADDPTIPRGPGSTPFDGEGLSVHPTTFLDEGVLRSWALNARSARKLGLSPTGHASRPSSGHPGETCHNLRLRPTDVSGESLIADVADGFYCTGMMGFGFNAATGDFSRGAEGFLIENGKLTQPVSEVTVSANFLDLFQNLEAVANDPDPRRSISAPSIRIREMTIAGR